MNDLNGAGTLSLTHSEDTYDFVIARKKCENSLYRFIQEAWHVVEPGTELKSNWTMEAVCEHLEAITNGEMRNLIINIPPRFTKSLIVNVFWPAWVWSKMPHKQFLFSAYSDSLAIRDSVKCRTLIQSNWYKYRWGKKVRLKADHNTKREYLTVAGGHRIVTTVGGSGTGKGADYIVADDPNDAKHARSKNKLEDTQYWWDKVMSTRLNDAKTGCKVVIQQRIAEGDLTGHILSDVNKAATYDHLCIPMKYEEALAKVTSIDWADPRSTEGELAWPERFGDTEVTSLGVDLGSDGFAGQMQQRPAPAEGAIFKQKWFRYYKELPEIEYKMLSVDCAFKETAKSDYVAMGVWGVCGANKYLLYVVKERLDFPKTIKEILKIHRLYPDLRFTLVEDKANGPAVISTLKHKIPGFIPFNPGKDSKESRAAAISPQVEAGNLWLPDPYYEPNRIHQSWCVEKTKLGATLLDDYVSELKNFPKGANDDCVDMTTQAFIKIGAVPSWFDELVKQEAPENTSEAKYAKKVADMMGWNLDDGDGDDGTGFSFNLDF